MIFVPPASVRSSGSGLGALGARLFGAQTCPTLQPKTILGEYKDSACLGPPGPAWVPWALACLVPRSAPHCSQRPFQENIRIPPASVRLASLRGSECLAFLTHTKNYFEQYYVFCSHP